MSKNETPNADANTVFMARQEFFRAIYLHAREVLEDLNTNVMPLFLETDLVKIEMHQANSYFDEDDLLKSNPALQQGLLAWADKYGINADWCIKMALRTLLYWSCINKSKEESAKHTSIEEAIQSPDKYLINNSKNRQDIVVPTYDADDAEINELSKSIIETCRISGRQFTGTPGELTWAYDKMQGGADLFPFKCNWNPYTETREEFKERINSRLNEYLDKKEGIFSHRIGKRTYLAKPEHFEWLVLFRVKYFTRAMVKERYPHITAETTISESKTKLETLLGLPKINRVGAPKKSS